MIQNGDVVFDAVECDGGQTCLEPSEILQLKQMKKRLAGLKLLKIFILFGHFMSFLVTDLRWVCCYDD